MCDVFFLVHAVPPYLVRFALSITYLLRRSSLRYFGVPLLACRFVLPSLAFPYFIVRYINVILNSRE